MLRSVRTSMVAIGVVVVLLTMQAGVDAKKKISKRKHRTTTGAPLVITLPTFTPVAPEGIPVNRISVMRDDSFVNSAGPAARTASANPSGGGGMSIDSAGDSASGDKKGKGRITIDPLRPLNPLAGTLLISEFRLRGPSGASDEFIEIYNNSGADHQVASISGTGYGVAASDGVVRCTIPNATVIPDGGHYLCVNNTAVSGYSLSTYPSGNGTTATGDATYTTDIPDNAGIALFNNNSGGASFSLANRFDAVGSDSEALTLYREGAGYATLTPFSINYAWVRDECGKGGSITTNGPCSISTPKDTDDNAADFYFVDTNGTQAGGGQRLGAPGPQNLSSPIQRNSGMPAFLLDATVANSSAPNRVRDFTSVPATNSTFGTLSIRRRFINATGTDVTRLRFRIIDLTTFPAPSGTADLRPITSGSVVVAGINDTTTCGDAGLVAPCTVTVQGTDLEGGEVGEVPNQPNGGGFNSSMSVGTITLQTPLLSGDSINVQFLLGLQQTGNFRIFVNIEALP